MSGRVRDNGAISGLQLGGKVDALIETSHSLNQTLLKLGLSGRYGNVSAAASLEKSRSVTEKSETIYFIENLFTIAMVRPQTVDGFFKDLATSDLEEQARVGNIGPSNLPVYVSSVSFGRILLVSMYAEESEETLRRTADLLVKGVKSKLQAEYSDEAKRVLGKTTFRTTAVGGDPRGVEALILSGNLSDYFDKVPALSTYKPISFTVNDLATDEQVMVSETTEYEARECAPEGGFEWVNGSGADFAFRCRAGGYIEGILGINFQPGRVEFKANETISKDHYGFGDLNGSKQYFVWFKKNGSVWQESWLENGAAWSVSSRADTWQAVCYGKGRTPQILNDRLADLKLPGWNQSFRCKNGGVLRGDVRMNGASRTLTFGADDTISVRDIVIAGFDNFHRMVRFNKNGVPWPDEDFQLWNTTWSFACNA